MGSGGGVLQKAMLVDLSLSEAQLGLSRGDFSCLELASAYLKAIEEKNSLQNSLLRVDSEGMLHYAKTLDRKLERGDSLSGLEGGFIAIKDNIHVLGMPTTCASRILEGFNPGFQAHVVDRLIEQGACITGKANCDEFAMGSSNETSAFGPVRNPHHADYVPGGSSGGSAASVAAGFSTAALGSDTGGSIRQPASFCGVVGLKPTYGRVSRFGLVAFASSFDQIGPLTRNVEDAWLVYDCIHGNDARDATSLPEESRESLNLSPNASQFCIGVSEEFFQEGIDPKVETRIRDCLFAYEKEGATLVKISLPHLSYALPAYYVLASAEASSNLARYDSIRFGPKLFSTGSLEQLYLQTRSKGFGDEVKRRIMLGTYVLSEGYYDAFYIQAQKIRTLIRRDFEEAFKICDLIVSPTCPGLPFKQGSRMESPLDMYLADLYTVPANITGFPAISIPCSSTTDTLPIGLQIMAGPLQESMLCSAARGFERMLAL
jgi:aspartyl-tRNA(Asn)/glutamyl-tRNA(Gln) amidotransferase subunit A